MWTHSTRPPPRSMARSSIASEPGIGREREVNANARMPYTRWPPCPRRPGTIPSGCGTSSRRRGSCAARWPASSPAITCCPTSWSGAEQDQPGRSVEVRGRIKVSPRLVLAPGRDGPTYGELFGERELMHARAAGPRCSASAMPRAWRMESEELSRSAGRRGTRRATCERVLEELAQREIINTGVIVSPGRALLPGLASTGSSARSWTRSSASSPSAASRRRDRAPARRALGGVPRPRSSARPKTQTTAREAGAPAHSAVAASWGERERRGRGTPPRARRAGARSRTAKRARTESRFLDDLLSRRSCGSGGRGWRLGS